MNRRKRAMIMIFVVIMIAAATTIVAASVDLGRMATYKQKQSEREAKWQLCLDSIKAIAVEDLVNHSGTTESFSKMVNGINFSVSTAPYNSWNPQTSTQVTISGSLDSQARVSQFFIGKQATVQPCQFGMFFTRKFEPDANTTVTGDIFFDGSVDASNLRLTGDVYSRFVNAPPLKSQTGSFFGRQPGQKISVRDAAYAAQASISTSGTSTLNNPSNLLSLSNSQLRYHNGNLTISGTTSGEITIYVTGSVIISGVRNAVSGTLGRLVVICNGDIQIDQGTCDVFAIATGKIISTGNNGARTVNGSLAGLEFTNTGNNNEYTVNFDSYFITNSDAGYRYWIPGQW